VHPWAAVRGARGERLHAWADLAQRIEAIKAVDTHAVSSLKPWGRNTMQREEDTVKREEKTAGESVAGADSAPESAADAPVAPESAAARITTRITAGNAIVTPGWAPPVGNEADMLAVTLARIRTLEVRIEEQQAELQALRAGLRGGAQSAAAPTAAEATPAAEAPVAEVPPLGLLAADGGVQSAVDDCVAHKMQSLEGSTRLLSQGYSPPESTLSTAEGEPAIFSGGTSHSSSVYVDDFEFDNIVSPQSAVDVLPMGGHEDLDDSSVTVSAGDPVPPVGARVRTPPRDAPHPPEGGQSPPPGEGARERAVANDMDEDEDEAVAAAAVAGAMLAKVEARAKAGVAADVRLGPTHVVHELCAGGR
jgi:hypothetical protein